ncbi:MAG: hypothetical protein IT539_00670 [Bradyrhizobiaceae bacterium]|nr:hypothetical protein [Bradyrhizobiaceae bacterium]
MAGTRSLEAAPVAATTNLMRAFWWVAAAAILGFAIPAVFSSVLRLERTYFLIPYAAIVAAFLAVFFSWNGFSFREFTRHWLLGVIGAIVIGYFVVQNVYSQPASAVPQGAALVFALLWFGIVYGVIDALLLNVMPVLAFHGPNFDDSNPIWRRRIMCGLFGIVASVVITAAYHFGFAEFRNASLVFPLIGNAIITAGYVVTRSPLAAIGAHTAMHVASILHGMETVVQLPPHY